LSEPVIGIPVAGGRVTGVETQQRSITAPVVVDAAGVWVRQVGGFEADPAPVDPRQQDPSSTTDDLPLDLDVLRRLAAQVTAEAPAAGTAPVAEHRGGLFTMSPDGRFVTGPVLDLPGLWVASGCNGSGFSSSLALGEALAAWITAGTPPPGLTALAPARFGRSPTTP
jgi:glycine/D-amino acid oxidase-like deaminating enzyme